MSDEAEDIRESGPFCRHWVEIGDTCDEPCATCSHTCLRHYYGADRCDVEGCPCSKFVDVERPGT